eukprot:510024-Lingulodinium_polyedra.AAC.1
MFRVGAERGWVHRGSSSDRQRVPRRPFVLRSRERGEAVTEPASAVERALPSQAHCTDHQR